MIAALLEGLAAVVARLPFRWLRAVGSPLGWLVGSLLRIRRAHVEASLERAGDTEPQKSARAMYRALGANVMELLWLSRRPDGVRDVCSLAPWSRAALESARAKGRGLVLAASHTGNWELAACAMARELDLTVIVKPIANRGVDAFMTRARRAHGLGLTLPEGALQPARDVLGRGGSIAMLIDQVPAHVSHGLPVEFLGARALVDRAPAALAAATGAPLVVVAFRREEDGTHRIEVLDVIDPPSRGRRAWTREAMRTATRALEGFVKRYPSQWLWMHRRWSAPRGTPKRADLALARSAG